MILLPKPEQVMAFLTRCVLHGEVRDVRPMHAGRDDDALVEDRREYLRRAKRRSRRRSRR